jgi:hypothetical protein
MDYRERFPGKAVFPVIHVSDFAQVERNLQVVKESAADGAFLIDHGSRLHPNRLTGYIERLHRSGQFRTLWLGANFLGLSNLQAIELAGELGLDGLWVDNAGHFGALGNWNHRLAWEWEALRQQRRDLLYFGGVAFKRQPQANDPEGLEAVVLAASGYVDILTTSGEATGHAADIGKLAAIAEMAGSLDRPVATASGVTLENAAEQFRFVDAVLVATGIQLGDDFYEIDPHKLERLVEIAHNYQPSQ